MSSILKVDTIQDQSGNNIINESGNVITIGASGDTITVPAGATLSGDLTGITNLTMTGDLTVDTNTLFVDASADKVGINTTSPARQLTVSGSTAPVIAIVDTGTSGSPSLFFGDSSADNVGKIQYSNATNSLAFTVNSSERMNIANSGRVGINVTSASGLLHVQSASSGASVNSSGDEIIAENSANAGISILSGNSNQGQLIFGDNGDNNVGRLQYDHSNNSMQFIVNASERARIDASGNLFVAKTSAAYQTVGHELLASGRAFHTADGSKTLSLNRLTSNGAIVDFYRLGTEIGNIGTAGSGTFYIAEATYGGLAFSTVGAGDINPCTPTGAVRDNAMDLGQPTARFKDLYLGGGAFLGGTGTANKLDDYEEGTFTPAITSASGSVTNSTQTGNYTKVGRLVYFDIRVILSAISSPSGSLTIAGLPFTGGISGRTGLVKFTTVANAGTLNLTNIMGAYIATGNQINVSSNDGLNSNASQLTATTQFDLSGMYQTN